MESILALLILVVVLLIYMLNCLKKKLLHEKEITKKQSKQAEELIKLIKDGKNVIASAELKLKNAEQELKMAKKEACNIKRISRDEILKIEEDCKKEVDRQNKINSDAIQKIRTECASLPSVVQWAGYIQEVIDNNESLYLIKKKNPAYSAREAVLHAKSETRMWRTEANIFKNIVSLYESEAPWLKESLDYTVDEIVEGLRLTENERISSLSHDDPVKMYLSSSEWGQLDHMKRNQLALDRYFEYRQKSAWLAGIMYERYIGYIYEDKGFDVSYQGANLGKNDLGIDLVCRTGNAYKLIQCKRLSTNNPESIVREKTVAQLYGASLVFSNTENILSENINPVIVTTSTLSERAKIFASILNVQYMENVRLDRYPCIKCNISHRDNQKIYHLPFDQKYDVTKIDRNRGECYEMTVAAAERKGFRRAFKWHG